MRSNPIQQSENAASHSRGTTPRHTYQDALSEREFERLLDACDDLSDPYRFEARLICLLAGRLGLRRGEIAHLSVAWLDWERKLLRVPSQEPCDCGYCRRQARSGTHQ